MCRVLYLNNYISVKDCINPLENKYNVYLCKRTKEKNKCSKGSVNHCLSISYKDCGKTTCFGAHFLSTLIYNKLAIFQTPFNEKKERQLRTPKSKILKQWSYGKVS